MAMYRVTPGAGTGVPISGQMVPGLTGQVMYPRSRATGAAQSEPHGLPDMPRGVHSAVPAPCRRGGARWCTQGGRVCQGRVRVRAVPRSGRVHIRAGVAARPGRGRARTSVRIVPELVPDSARAVP